MLKIKSFIYRFSNVFGCSIYLAKKEEDAYIRDFKPNSPHSENLHRGMWQAEKGFTTVWTYKMSFKEKIIAKTKHAFKG